MHGPYLKRSQTGVYNFGMAREQPAVDMVDGRSVATVAKKVPYVLQLEPSPLWLPTMHSSSSPAFSQATWPSIALHSLRLCTQGRSIFRKYLRTFKIYGIA